MKDSHEFRAVRTVRGKPVITAVTIPGPGIYVQVWGGDSPHIGAAGIVSPEGEITVSEFPGHREGCICRDWAEALFAAGLIPAVIGAGIHYDGLDRDGIREVLSTVEDMREEMFHRIAAFQE